MFFLWSLQKFLDIDDGHGPKFSGQGKSRNISYSRANGSTATLTRFLQMLKILRALSQISGMNQVWPLLI
jgi:hypothetical protein